MRITDTAIKYRTTILVLTAVLTFGGIYSYVTIPKEANPSIEVPQIVVTTIYPGASPDDVESLITQEIEGEIQGVNGIKEIRSTSTEGVSSIVVEFEPDISIDEAFSKVRDKVDVAKADLPSDVEEPAVSEIDFTQFPIMTINLSAPYPLTRLKRVAENLEDELEAIPSVLEVDVIGGLDREVQINVDLAKLQGYNLTYMDLVNAVFDENTNVPGGSIDVDELNYLVRIDGEIEDPQELENLVIASPNGIPVYVRDVAQVDFGFADRVSYSRLAIFKEEDANDELYDLPSDQQGFNQVISLNVKKRSGDNILETVDAVGGVLDGYAFPSGTQVIITGDQSVFVEDLIKDLENNIISGLIFVIAVLLFFLGVRNATLVGIAIPLSMLISFIVFQAAGYTLNFIILFSMIIALGMLVDNAIVIVENIYRYREEGKSRFDAAKEGTAEVAGAVIASTATTVAVFVPMLFWPGIIGEFMSWMPLTLIITLVCSLFVAIIINPVITGIFVRLESEPKQDRPPLARRVTFTVILLLGMMLGIANWKTLLVIVVATPTIMMLHRYVLKPVGDNFVQTGLPRLNDRYRAFLTWMLHRDYSGKRALLRNTAALTSLTIGFVLTILSLLISGALGQTASMVLLVPGGLLLVLGIVGVLLHTFEVTLLGKGTSIKVGLIFAVLSAGFLGLMALMEKDVDSATAVELVVFPLLIAVGGLVGKLFIKRDQLLLSDNRSLLLNTVLGSLFMIIFMFTVAPTGVEFFPTTSPRQVQVTAEGPLGMNLEASDEIAAEARRRLQSLLAGNENARDNVKNMIVNVGVSADAQFGSSAASPERSRITMNLVDYPDRAEDSFITLERIRDELQGIPGAEIKIDKDQDGPPTGAPVNIEITGADFEVIARILNEIKQILIEASDTQSVPGLVDIQDNLDAGRPEVLVHVDRERAGRFNLSTRQIASTVRSAVNGIEAGTFRDGEDEYDIIVRLRELDRNNLESLRTLTIMDEGTQIPLTAVADLEVSAGLGSVTRLDLQRVAVVTGQAAPGFNNAAILAQVQALLAPYQAEMPAGYQLAFTGENEEQAESFGFLSVVLLVGVALIFMIMIAQFNHVSSPFIIMVAVGFSLIGVLLGLILTRTPFGLMTFIGVISLAGIVVNNNIVLIDYTMQLRDRGMEKQKAIIEAGATRLRPVLLTALTTVLGLVPLTFGINVDFVGLLTDLDPNFQFGSENTQFWGPMGTAIISGLTFATFLTLVIVPVMYSVFDSLAIRLQFAFRSPEDAAAHLSAGHGTSEERARHWAVITLPALSTMKRLEDFPDAHLRLFDRPDVNPDGDVRDVYLIGICGTGMGSLAGLFHEAGYSVRGSDAATWPPMSDRLAAMQIPVKEGYDAANLDPQPDVVVVGNACTPTHPEAARVREEGWPQLSLPEAVSRFFIRDRRSLVVAGTHGKTTTTSLLAHVFRSAGRDPGFLVGGVMNNGNVSYSVGSGPHFIIEGDEYDTAYFDKRPKFLHYKPRTGIVTSVEFDHADIYASMDDYREAFGAFAGLIPEDGLLVLCADNPEVAALAAKTNGRVSTYGLDRSDVNVTAVRISTGSDGQRFDLMVDGVVQGRVWLPLSGQHNLLNALAVATVALDEGLDMQELIEGFGTFQGIQRRQQIRGEAGGVIVVDDFAHHPTAVRATVQAAAERWPSRRVVAVFEPRSNSSRRKVFEEGYATAFDQAGAVFLSRPPFRHNDRPEDFMDVDAVIDRIRQRGIPADSAEGAEALLPLILQEIRPGDVALIMSNGGFGGIHDKLLLALTQ